MPRIKLKKLDRYDFIYEREIKVGDINYGGHLGNDSIVTITHEARLDMMRRMGISELDLGDGKTGIIMADLAINFLGEGFMFDKLIIESAIGEIGNSGFRVFHYFHRGDDAVALAETGIVAFNYSERRVARLPEVFVKAVEKIKTEFRD
jgi:acyl-CoA thioesterase FadM